MIENCNEPIPLSYKAFDMGYNRTISPKRKLRLSIQDPMNDGTGLIGFTSTFKNRYRYPGSEKRENCVVLYNKKYMLGYKGKSIGDKINKEIYSLLEKCEQCKNLNKRRRML